MPHREHVLGNILIVDDIPDNLRLLSKLLAARGYNVRPAPSGTHALSSAQKDTPDLILLDVVMPEMNGYEVCRILKSQERTKNIPVIFLSALSELEDKMAGFEVGGVDYITKPFHEKEVMLRVETHLKIRNLQQKLLTETARFKTLAEATFEGILIHIGGRVVDVNPEAGRLFHCQESQLIGSKLMDLVPENILQLLLSNTTTPLKGEVMRVDKSRVPVEFRTKEMPLEDQQVGVTAIRDLTLQKRMEQEKKQLLDENIALKLSIQDRYKLGNIIGRSSAMQSVYELITKAAVSTYPVVIYGESGTGKELAARTIHDLRYSNEEPFIIVNCGAVTEALFEREFFGHRKGTFTDAVSDEPGYLDAAHMGTLFLDEVGELPLPMQVKLLRVFESGEFTPVGDVTAKKVDIRIVAATNKDLPELVKVGKFREDLFYRLQVIEITIPPLRERREDIRLLVEYILSQQKASDKITKLPEKLREMLYQHEWPGNIRELKNTLQRYLATDIFTLPGKTHDLTEEDITSSKGLHHALESLEKKIIAEALQQTNWHRGKAAEALQIPRRSLQRKILKYDLNPI